MKLCYTLIVLVVVSLVCARGADNEADHAALRSIKTVYEEAIRSNNLSRLAPFIAPNTTGVMVTGEEVKGMEGLEAYWAKIKNLMGPGGSYEVLLKPNRSEIYGDLAIAHGSTEDTVRTDKSLFKFTSLWTAVCQKQAGQWKVLRLQGTMDPVSNPFINARINFNRMVFGGGGFISGLALMGLVIMFRGRKVKPSSTSSP